MEREKPLRSANSIKVSYKVIRYHVKYRGVSSRGNVLRPGNFVCKEASPKTLHGLTIMLLNTMDKKIGVVDLLEKRTESHQETDFIVVICKNKECVIPVDEVKDIFQTVENDIVPIPPFAAKGMKKTSLEGCFRSAMP